MKGTLFLGACCAVAVTVAAQAEAAPYTFVITGSQTIEFVLDSSPTPGYINPDADSFVLFGVAGTVNGQADTFSLGFGGPSFTTNFGLFGSGVLSNFFTTGDALYTGSKSVPTFKLGTFTLTPTTAGPNYSLTISAVPEPASWAMLLAGFGALGAAVRRRGNVAVRVRFSG